MIERSNAPEYHKQLYWPSSFRIFQLQYQEGLVISADDLTTMCIHTIIIVVPLKSFQLTRKNHQMYPAFYRFDKVYL